MLGLGDEKVAIGVDKNKRWDIPKTTTLPLQSVGHGQLFREDGN
jgi:hypothetical protein